MAKKESMTKALTSSSLTPSRAPVSYDAFIQQFADGINERLGRINRNLFDFGDFLVEQCHWGKVWFNKTKELVFTDVHNHIKKYTPATLRDYEITAKFIASIKDEILRCQHRKIEMLDFSDYREIAKAKLPQQEKFKIVDSIIERAPPQSEIRQLIKTKHFEIYPPTDQNWLIPFDCWRFLTCDPRFGEDGFPGRIPGQIIQNLIHYYMKGDIFLSVYPGSHTDKDVCDSLGKECRELNQNVISLWQVPDKSADLVFHDPPYWHAKQEEYNQENDLAQMSLKDFYSALDFSAQESYRVLRNTGRVAIIIGNERNPYEDLGIETYQIFRKFFHPIDRIIIPYAGTSAMHTPWAISKAKEDKYMLNGYRDLMVFEKEVPQ